MSKSKKPQNGQPSDNPQSEIRNPQSPVAMVKPVPETPDLRVAAEIAAQRIVARERGEGPACPKCGSGMTVNRTERISTNHPIRDGFRGRIVRYYQCKNPKCPIGRAEPFKEVVSGRGR